MVPLALPILFGAAILVLGKKKKKRKRVTGEPDETPGGGWTEPDSRAPGEGYITYRPSGDTLPIVGWNTSLAQKARTTMTAGWEAGNKVLSGGKFFILMRNTAMAIWPHVAWPTTINDEMKMVEVAPGNRIPRWVYNLGNEGPKVLNIWLRLRDLAWNITGYKPPV